MVCQVFEYMLYRFMNSRHSVIYALLLLLLNYIFCNTFFTNGNTTDKIKWKCVALFVFYLHIKYTYNTYTVIYSSVKRCTICIATNINGTINGNLKDTRGRRIYRGSNTISSYINLLTIVADIAAAEMIVDQTYRLCIMRLKFYMIIIISCLIIITIDHHGVNWKAIYFNILYYIRTHCYRHSIG